jgi:hypothetical protein
MVMPDRGGIAKPQGRPRSLQKSRSALSDRHDGAFESLRWRERLHKTYGDQLVLGNVQRLGSFDDL